MSNKLMPSELSTGNKVMKIFQSFAHNTGTALRGVEQSIISSRTQKDLGLLFGLLPAKDGFRIGSKKSRCSTLQDMVFTGTARFR